jgi:hypothetical protein
MFVDNLGSRASTILFVHNFFSVVISFYGGSVLIFALITISSDMSRKFSAKHGRQRTTARL